jgi:RNA polymerase sigma factor (sigma-70 family)
LVRPADAVSRPAEQPARNVELERFYRAELPRVLRFLAFRGAQPADAADAAHHAIVGVCVRWAQVREMERPAAYLRRVADNEWKRLDRRRRLDVRRAVAGQWIDLETVEDLYGRDDVKVVLMSLAALPERQRQVMAWLYDGYTVEEIAEQLGMKVSTVRSTVRHARKKLRLLGIGGEG